MHNLNAFKCSRKTYDWFCLYSRCQWWQLSLISYNSWSLIHFIIKQWMSPSTLHEHSSSMVPFVSSVALKLVGLCSRRFVLQCGVFVRAGTTDTDGPRVMCCVHCTSPMTGTQSMWPIMQTAVTSGVSTNLAKCIKGDIGEDVQCTYCIVNLSSREK